MRHTDFAESEVFANFADLMMKEGRLEKKAELLYADFDMSVKPELDLGLGVFADKRTSLYGVTSETGDKLVGDAHKGGGTNTQLDNKPDGDLGRVETIVERHKTMEDIARKMPKPKMAAIVAKLITLANQLDSDGFEAFAMELDENIAKLANDPFVDIKMPQPSVESMPRGPDHKPPVAPTAPAAPQHKAPVKPPVKPGQVQFEMGPATVTNAPAAPAPLNVEMGTPVVTNAPKG